MNEPEIIFSVRESPEGGYEACALGHWIFTQADTADELNVMCADAVFCHFGYALPFRIVQKTSAAEAERNKSTDRHDWKSCPPGPTK